MAGRPWHNLRPAQYAGLECATSVASGSCLHPVQRRIDPKAHFPCRHAKRIQSPGRLCCCVRCTRPPILFSADCGSSRRHLRLCLILAKFCIYGYSISQGPSRIDSQGPSRIDLISTYAADFSSEPTVIVLLWNSREHLISKVEKSEPYAAKVSSEAGEILHLQATV